MSEHRSSNNASTAEGFAWHPVAAVVAQLAEMTQDSRLDLIRFVWDLGAHFNWGCEAVPGVGFRFQYFRDVSFLGDILAAGGVQLPAWITRVDDVRAREKKHAVFVAGFAFARSMTHLLFAYYLN